MWEFGVKTQSRKVGNSILSSCMHSVPWVPSCQWRLFFHWAPSLALAAALTFICRFWNAGSCMAANISPLLLKHDVLCNSVTDTSFLSLLTQGAWSRNLTKPHLPSLSMQVNLHRSCVHLHSPHMGHLE